MHLVKLCVGTESVEQLAAWQTSRGADRVAAGGDGRPRHVTRMWPRRSEDLLRGGSLFWVIRGLICVRQRIEALERVTGADGVARCAIVMAPELVRVLPRPRSAFQGWRYLAPGDAPPDLDRQAEDEPALPPGLQEAMARFGVGGA
ncbi:MAG TPA: DUF1489 domain-containing protein [Thermohalobaculum sp.]|nr:DUF1489 domain-containing protein [Thermohalobaculum sp.]